ncbi:conserved membrane hypothetical protein [Desulfamplus magnetovallimortis]|uniref:Uncharacterized protein n=1 Tax=Desulfamplus magnetovallimortis TaxID=1246637 RepID=A0A1W1H5X4_9BACT|nr:hypothetical protein [Desulfamplus magnetovallimortis]SLM27852.1 conserved membrane hypothetical protein [Desulfamplus magnetovallimortis]
MRTIDFNALFFRSRKAFKVFPVLFISYFLLTYISCYSLCHAGDLSTHKWSSIQNKPASNETENSFDLSGFSGADSVYVQSGADMKCTYGFQSSLYGSGHDLYIPDVLKPWVNWVSHGNEDRLQCTPRYNDANNLECLWPSHLELTLNNEGGSFSQTWHVSRSTLIPLPGDVRQWPMDVTINGLPVTVISRNNRPVAQQNSAQFKTYQPYKISGIFSWKKQPEYIQIPESSALVNLKLNGENVEFPNLDLMGRLWLKKKHQEHKEENRLNIQAFRLVDDTIPAVTTIYISLDVSGSPREISLGPIADPDTMTPLLLESRLPAKLESNAALRLQVRPGQYGVTVKFRHSGPLKSLVFQKPEDKHWPNDEIWSIVRHSDLRIVEIKGGMAIDPRHTSLPDDWKGYPAFRMLPGEELVFNEVKRGDPVPAPDQLTLDRTMWLHFDGSGYTIQDRIQGKKSTGWRLEMEPEMQPGRVSVDGEEQLITRRQKQGNSDSDKSGNNKSGNTHAGEETSGVELRKGVLDLVSEGRFMGSITNLPATGWQHEFQQVKGKLLLPPGWKLIHAGGIDNIPRTWVKRWTLLDFFIVLVFTVATAKLYSVPLAFTGFFTLLLTYHEPAAPRLIWLYLLGGFALIKNLPQNSRLLKFVKKYQLITAIILIFLTIPYAITSLRVGIYPQLANPWISMNDAIDFSDKEHYPETKASQQIANGNQMDDFSPEPLMERGASQSRVTEQLGSLPRVAGKARQINPPSSPPSSLSYSIPGYGAYDIYRKKASVMQHDPKSLTQTGPGIPLWRPFDTISFNWSGPVAKGETISFYYTGPVTNCSLAFLRVGLILLLAAGMFGFGYKKGKGFLRPGISSVFSTSLTFTSLCMTFIISFMAAHLLFNSNLCFAQNVKLQEQSTSIPSQQMLDELEKRIFEPDECFPSCADIQKIKINIENQELSVILDVNASVDTAIPLPGHARHWLPSKVTLKDLDKIENRENSDSQPPSDAHLFLDGQESALFRENEVLWIMVPEGRQRIILEGTIRNQSTFQMPLPMKPRHATVTSQGWNVQGIQPDDALDDQLQFRRVVPEASGSDSNGEEILENGVLPPFARVERRILLGLVWKVQTTVERLTPSDSAMVMNIPLLPNESVTTQGVRVKNGEVQVNMNINRNSFSWESFLEPSESILLKHADTREWTEIWTLDASPVFHVETSGIPVILHQINHRWYPTWHPWPGETVKLSVTRPAGVDGRTLTIEKSHLELKPGRKSSIATLTLKIKSSQGGQHTIVLPPDTELQDVKINSKSQLIRQEGRNVPLPINPGSQTVVLKWRGGMTRTMGMFYRTPEIDLGTDSVNAAIDLHLSRDRWPLFIGGEQLAGPAVLFWSVMLVVFIAAFGLASSGLSPLKFHHWFLLGTGMAMSSLSACLFVALWLIIMDLRKKANTLSDTLTPQRFNFIQIGLAGLTFLAIASLVFAISNGLIGHPEMNIKGNGSSAYFLRWYQDISETIVPRGWLLSLPMLVYRALMLSWALWISVGLVHILKWGWKRFTEPVMWYTIPKKPFEWNRFFKTKRKEGNDAKNGTDKTTQA